MHRLFRSTLIVASFVLTVASASIAFAAPASWQEIDVSLRSENSGGVMLISGTLPDTVSLPAEAELAVPAGSQLQWIGQILGGAASADPELKYTKATANGLDVYRFTLTKSRIAQVEVPTSAGAAFDGSSYTSALKWSAPQAVPEVRMSVRVPQGAQVPQAIPGATIQPADSGYSYYTKTFKDVKAGDQLDLTFAYTLPAATAALKSASSAKSSSDTIAIIVVLGVFIGGFGLVLYNVSRKMGAKAVTEEKAARSDVKLPAQGRTSQSRSRKPSVQQTVVETPATKRIKPTYVILAVIGALVVGVLIAGSKGTTAKVVDGKITKSFGGASPCTSALVPVMANQGVDLAAQGDKLVDAFTGLEGVGDVTLDLASSTVEVKFCESQQTEDSVRQALAGTGLVTLGAAQSAAAPTTASLDSSGKKQTASVDTASGAFSPGKVVLKAGVPAEIAFGQASGCITEVIFSELGVEQDLKAGPAAVKLPALAPGTYAFACAMGHQTGELVVQ